MNWKAILAGGLAVSALVVIGIAVAGGGPVLAPATPTADTASTSPSASAAPAPVTSTDAPMVTPPAAPAPMAVQPAGQVPLPTSVSIPALKAMSTLIPLGVNPDLTVQVPDVQRPEQASWFDLGVRPGEVGSAVLLGHVDGAGRLGIFHGLSQLNLGDVISVGRADGSVVSFAVYKVTTVKKAQFPSTAFYGATPGPELHLATCGGPFDKMSGNYADSVLVFAKLVS